jgi:hypothetical protein
MIEQLELFKWLAMAALSGWVWFMKRTLDNTEHKIEELEKRQQKFSEDYLHKNDFKEFKSELRSMFEEIRTDIRELKK